MTTFRELVGTAYSNGTVKNLTMADGPVGERPAAEVLAEMVSKAVSLVDGIANLKAMTAAEREAGTEAQRLNGWIKSLGANNSSVVAAMTRAQARIA